MFTFIQDYKDYRQQKKNVKSCQTKLATKFRDMVQPISFSELDDYEHNLKLLTMGGKTAYAGKDVQALKKYMDEKAHLVHLPSCFCTIFASSYLIPTGIIQSIIFSDFAEQERSGLKEKDVIKCIHNPDDGVISENHCANCSKDTFRNLLEYHYLKGQLQDAQQAEKKAKQKFLDNFGFLNKSNNR